MSEHVAAQAPGQTERERFAAKMEMLADWFDADDFAKGRAGRTEVQEDLRRWAAAARELASAAAPPGEPLTHFFHCWRFPAHHACAVALIERQGDENDREIVRAGNAERALREIKHAIEDAATGTDAEVAETAGAVLAIARRALTRHRRQPRPEGTDGD